MTRTLAIVIALLGAAGSTCLAQLQPAQPRTPFFYGFPPGSASIPGLPGAATHPDVPAGYILMEGDIQVRLEEYAAYLSGADGTFTGSFWPIGPLAFDFSANVDATNQQRAINAMTQISNRCALTFVPRTNQSNWIRFNDSTGNNSPVGMQGGQQTINIVSWGNQIVICHEIFHSLGYRHEQSRPDRDTFVTINLGNVCQTCCSGNSCNHNFDIIPSAATYGFYDFDSFMHYPRDGFSTGGDTITVNPPWNAQWQNAIGQTNHFSIFDEITCRGIYKYSSDFWWRPGGGGTGAGNLPNPIGHPTFAAAYTAMPVGGTLFIKDSASFPAIGTYSKAMTIRAPLGATLGN